MVTRKGGPSNEGGSGSNGSRKAGRPTVGELGRRKQKVMKVATALFVRHGYASTSLVDIAKGAGVATRTVYQHFGDKQAIFHQVMFARETAAVYPAPKSEPDDSFLDSMLKAGRYIVDVSLRASTVDLMRLTIAESWRFPELTKKLTDATYSRFCANVQEIFDELVRRRLISDADTALSAAMFVDLILGTTPLLVYAGWQSPPAEPEWLKKKIELFINGRYGADIAEDLDHANRTTPASPSRSSKGERVSLAALPLER